MNNLEQIIADIRALQQQLLFELQQKQDEYYYIIRGKRVRFQEETRRYHKTLAKSLRSYLADAPLVFILTSPIIYACFLTAPTAQRMRGGPGQLRWERERISLPPLNTLTVPVDCDRTTATALPAGSSLPAAGSCETTWSCGTPSL